MLRFELRLRAGSRQWKQADASVLLPAGVSAAQRSANQSQRPRGTNEWTASRDQNDILRHRVCGGSRRRLLRARLDRRGGDCAPNLSSGWRRSRIGRFCCWAMRLACQPATRQMISGEESAVARKKWLSSAAKNFFNFLETSNLLLRSF